MKPRVFYANENETSCGEGGYVTKVEVHKYHIILFKTNLKVICVKYSLISNDSIERYDHWGNILSLNLSPN